MTAIERINLLLTTTDPNQIDSSFFWRDLIEQHMGHSDATNPEDRRYADALGFMYMAAVTIEETAEVFEPELVRAIFDEHVQIWCLTSGIRLKRTEKIPTP